MQGQDYWGNSICYMQGKFNEEFCLKWTSLAVFMPIMRNHYHYKDFHQEPFAMHRQVTQELKTILEFRYSFVLQLYSTAIKASQGRDQIIKSMVQEYYFNLNDVQDLLDLYE